MRYQHICNVIADQIDAYEQRHGRLDDRSCFDGDIVVPPHLRNATATLGHRGSRLSLLSGLSRSRTFLTLPSAPGGGRQTLLLHGSVPDLSRSLPNTPLGSVGKQRGRQRGDSVESVLEEDLMGANGNNANEPDTSPLSITHAAAGSVLKDGVELRRKSDHDVVIARKLSHGTGPVPRGPQVTTPSAYRNQQQPPPPPPPKRISSTSSFIGIPFRVHTRRQSNVMATSPTASAGSPLRHRKESPLISASAQSLHTAALAADSATTSSSSTSSNSKWGNVRNSNSFSDSFNVGSLSTKYTIPRPHLVPVQLNGNGEPVPLSDQQIILKALGTDDSAA